MADTVDKLTKEINDAIPNRGVQEVIDASNEQSAPASPTRTTGTSAG